MTPVAGEFWQIPNRAIFARCPAVLRFLVLSSLGVVGNPLCQADSMEPRGWNHLIVRLEALEEEHQGLCVRRTDEGDFRARIMRLGNERGAGAEGASQGPSGVARLNLLLFNRLGMRASRDLRDPCNLLPSAILERKQGYCVGLVALYLALAEHLGLPVFAVATPSHVFVRYDDGETRINVETQEGGANVPDERYVREMKIPARSIEQGIFMRNLTADEFLAQVHNNLGVVYSARRDYGRAAGEYAQALRLDPRLPAACYNLANDLLHQGRFRRAARLFSRSLRLYPTDVWALNNRGLAYLKLGKPGKARRDFEAALGIDPGFEPARVNLEAVDGR